MAALLAAGATAYRYTWGQVLVRALVTVAIVAAVVLVLFVVLPRVFPRRCPRCFAVLGRVVSPLRAEEARDDIILPSINLIRETCARCGFEARRVVADTGQTFFETSYKAKKHFAVLDNPDVARANVRAVTEWDKIFEDLRTKHELLPPRGSLTARGRY